MSKYDQITWLYILIKTLNQKKDISQGYGLKKKIWNQSPPQKNWL